MDPVFFTQEQKNIIDANPIKDIIDGHRASLPRDLSSFEQDIDKDTKRRLRAFFFLLAGTTPAELIDLGGLDGNLSDKLVSFTNAWGGEKEFPMILKSEFSSLLDKVASRATDLNIWTAVAKLLKAFDVHTLPKTKTVSFHSSRRSDVMRDLEKDWTNDYFPHSLLALQSLIREYQKRAVKKYYVKTLVFVQSSGMGKSRLVDSFGQECPMINFILREEETTGFPPADPDILKFLREKPLPGQMNIAPAKSYPEGMTAVVWNHALAAALLQASFEIFNGWVKSQQYTIMKLEDLAKSRHTDMAPRNDNRTQFCQSVAERARVIANDLISKTDWTNKFSKETPSQVHHELESEEPSNPLNGLRTTVQELINNLQQTQHKSNDGPFLVIVFDEASSLIRNTAFGGLYVALNRIISCLKGYALWSFFLSTESLIGQLVPPDNAQRTGNYQEEPSARFTVDQTEPPLKRFPPFVALQLDVEDRRRMQNSAGRDEELRKPLSTFAEPKHMAIFGRPLWYAYENAGDMNDVARLKLLGGRQRSNFEHGNKDHVFAALSFRLALDVCLQNPSSISFTRTAVNSFMRVVISMDEDTGTMDTLTPSEPVLAKAAMEHLCREANWTNSIRTLTKDLLEPGLIEKGQKGELYARLVLILAHDWVRWAIYLQPETSEFVPEFQPTFTVSDLLKSLYGEDHLQHIQTIPERIRKATMNFTHFVPAYENLTPKVIPALCHDLLRRSAAMQLAFKQKTFDLLLPIYYGPEAEEFDRSKCGVILVQVKNRDKATTLEHILKEDFTKVSPKDPRPPPKREPAVAIRKRTGFAFKRMANPILFLLFDLGVSKSTLPLVQVSRSKTPPDLWAIHSRGHDKKVFGCLKHIDSTDASEQFFTSMPKGESLAEQLARRNRIFGELQRSYRYEGFEDDDDGAEDDDDGAQDDDDGAQEGELKTLPIRGPQSGKDSSKKKKKKKKKEKKKEKK